MQNVLSSALSTLSAAAAIVAQTDTQQNSCMHAAAAATATALSADTEQMQLHQKVMCSLLHLAMCTAKARPRCLKGHKRVMTLTIKCTAEAKSADDTCKITMLIVQVTHPCMRPYAPWISVCMTSVKDQVVRACGMHSMGGGTRCHFECQARLIRQGPGAGKQGRKKGWRERPSS